MGRTARRRPRPAAGARPDHELVRVRWTVARRRLVDHAAEGAARPGAGLGRHGTGAQSHRSRDRSDPALFRGRRSRGKRRQRARLRRGRRRLGGIVARRRHAHHAGRPPPASRRGGRRGRAVPSGRDPRPPRRGGLGRSRQRPLPSRARLPRRSARARLDRPRQARQRARLRRRPGRDCLRRQQAGDPAGQRSRSAAVHRPRRTARGFRVVHRHRVRRQPRDRLSRSDRRRQGDPPGRSADRAAHRRLDGARLQQSRPRGTRRGRRDVDRHGLRGRRLRPELGADGALRQGERHDQRRPRSERVLRRRRRHSLAGLEPGSRPLPLGDSSGAGAAAQRRDHLGDHGRPAPGSDRRRRARSPGPQLQPWPGRD